MPTKTIYVSNDDQAVFDRAQDVAGENLSSVIVQSLKELIVRKEAQSKGMKEITAQVGTAGLLQEKRFRGRLILKWGGGNEDKTRAIQAKVYKTAKGKIAVELVIQPDHNVFRQRDFWMKADYFDYTAENQLLVFDTVEETEDKLPSALVKLIRQAESRDDAPIEYLDI